MPRGRGWVRRSGAAFFSLVAVLALAAPAAATVRYTSPAGTVASGACTDPAGTCRIDWAFNNAMLSNDELVLAPGDYGSSGTPLVTPLSNNANNVTVHAQPGARARIFINAPVALTMNGNATALRDVEVDASGTAVAVFGALKRVIGRSDTTYGCAGGEKILDTLCVSRLNTALNENAAVGSPFTYNVTLRNVTAIAQDGIGQNAIEFDSGTNATFNVTAVNVIARGSSRDVVATNSAGNGVTINIGYSNFATTQTTGSGTSIVQTPPGSNQAPAPAFVNAAAGDYHEAAGSPTIDAGLTDPLNGQFDLDGNKRALGASTDIGAFEFVPAVTPSFAAPTAPTTTTRPVASLLSLRVDESKVRARIRCQGSAGSSCSGRIRLTVDEVVADGRVVGLREDGLGFERERESGDRRDDDAPADRGHHHHTHIRRVTVGQVSYTIAAGKTQTVSVRLNATGRELLERFDRLSPRITVTLPSASGATTTISRP